MNRKLKNVLCILLLLVTMVFAGCDSFARVNIDLSTSSSLLVQSTVQEMQTAPQSYKGKVIKLRVKAYEDGDYHYVIGPDGDACCNWEIPIKLGSNVDDYPTSGKRVVMIGKYCYGTIYSSYVNWYLEVIEFK